MGVGWLDSMVSVLMSFSLAQAHAESQPSTSDTFTWGTECHQLKLPPETVCGADTMPGNSDMHICHLTLPQIKNMFF